MSRRARLVLCAALLVVALPSVARAAGTTTIDFDNLAVNTAVNEQYAGQGVRFGTAESFGLPAAPGEPCIGYVRDAGIRGNSLAISCTYHEIHPGTNIAIEFEDPRRQISYTLKNVDRSGTRVVRISEYKINHELILRTTAQLPAGVAVPVSLAARPSADIAYLTIDQEIPDGQGQGPGEGVLLDDISAPIEDGRSPAFTLALLQPAVDIVEASTGTAAVGVRRFGGSTGGISFSAGPLPPGVAGVQFDPNPVSGRDPTTMRISLDHNVHADLQIPIKITSTGAPGAGTGAITSGVVTVHPQPALSFSPGPITAVPGCAKAGATYFSVKGDLTGNVDVNAYPVAEGPVRPSGDTTHVGVHGAGVYSFEFPFSERYPPSDPRALGDTVFRYTLNPGYGDTAVSGDQLVRSRPVRVDSITSSFPDYSTAIVARGTLPYEACKLRFVDDIGQEYAIVAREVEGGKDVFTLKPPVDFAAVSAAGGLRVLAPDGHELTRTPPIAVASFRNTYAVRNANSGRGAGSTIFPWDDFVRTFGEDDAYACFIGCVKDPLAVDYRDDFLAQAKQYEGLCFGYSVTALRFRGYDQSTLRASAYEPGAANAYALTDFADGSAIKRDIVRWHFSQNDAAFAQATKRPFPGPASMAQRLVDWKATVHGLIADHGAALVLIAQGTNGHALVATRVVDNPDGGFTLSLYDPNAPYSTIEQFDSERRANALASSTIVVMGDGSWSGSSLGWKGDLTTLMFPYNWPTGQANLPSNFSVASWFSSAVTSLTADGKETLKADGMPLGRAPVAIQSSYSGGKDDYRYILDKGHTYEAELRRDGGGALRFSALGLGSDAVLTGPAGKAGQRDRVTVAPGRAQLGYEPGRDAAGVTLHVVDADGAKVRHTADVTLDVAAGKPDLVNLAGDSLTIDHRGAPTKVAVALGSLGSGPPDGGQLAGLRLRSGQRLELKPRWGSLGIGVRYLVRDVKGRVVRRGTARMRPSRTVRLGSLGARLKGGKAIVSGRVAKGGRSPLLAVSVEALGAGGRATARRGASLAGSRARGRYKLAVKLPKLPHGGRLRVTATLLDQDAGLGAGVARKSVTLRSSG